MFTEYIDVTVCVCVHVSAKTDITPVILFSCSTLSCDKIADKKLHTLQLQ